MEKLEQAKQILEETFRNFSMLQINAGQAGNVYQFQLNLQKCFQLISEALEDGKECQK